MRRALNGLARHAFIIIESDRLPYERQCAIIKYLISIGLPIKMAVDTRGASLHAWLDIRGISIRYINRLCVFLCGIHDGLEPNPLAPGHSRRKFIGGMGCDPATFRGSQPARLPGATRPAEPEKGKAGGMQLIVYLA